MSFSRFHPAVYRFVCYYRVTPYELRGYELNVKVSTLGVDHMGRY